MKKKHIFTSLLHSLSDITRSLLGMSGVCIYPISCRTYAQKLLQEKPFYKAIPLIVLQVLSCNPITVLWWKLKKK